MVSYGGQKSALDSPCLGLLDSQNCCVLDASRSEGPVQGLWLDRSEVKGKLNRMKVAKVGEQTNVCLVWEGVNEVKGEKTFY